MFSLGTKAKKMSRNPNPVIEDGVNIKAPVLFIVLFVSAKLEPGFQ